MSQSSYLCPVCQAPATYMPEMPGDLVSCDEHLGIIAALNKVRGRIYRLTYTGAEVPNVLSAQCDALTIMVERLRKSYE